MKALRAYLCLLVAFAVLAFGSNDVWSESVLEIGAALLLLRWAILWYRSEDAKIQWNPLNWPLLGFLGIGILQLLIRGTAYPFLTRVELLKLTAYFFVFFLAAQAFRTREDLSKLAWFIALFCFAVSLLGVVQYFTSSGAIYWLPEFRLRTSPFGPYPNRSDFAGFVELTLPVGLALLIFRGVSRDLFPLMTLLAIVPVSAIVLSSSRGGIISFAFELGVLALLAWKSGALRFKATHAVAVGAVALAAVGIVLWLGIGTTRERFSHLDSHDVSLARRISMARGAERVFLDHPIKGCGLGTIVAVYPRYETAYDGRLVEHVHDDYLEALAETGLLGGLCGLMFLWIFFHEARKNFGAEQGRLSRAIHAGGIVAVSGILMHSFVEFNLHIPANALLFFLQAYLATSLPLPSSPVASRHRHRAAE